jgi:AraC family transcriptional regulator, transcriptional activator of pobA
MRFDSESVQGLTIRPWKNSLGAQSEVPFVVSRIEAAMDEVGSPSKPLRHGFFTVLYITEGAGTYYMDFEGFSLVPGAMFFVNPGKVHYADVDEPLQGYLLSFPEGFLSIDPSRENAIFELAFFQSPDREPVATFDKVASREIADVIESLLAEYLKRGNGYFTVIRSYLHILLVRASRGFRAPIVPRTESSAIATTRRFRSLVAEQVRTVRSVNAYAQQLGISPGHLHDVVKSSAGVTPSDIIQQELVLEAKRLLAHSEMSVAEVGHHLCFDDPAYFGRYFRRNQKLSPGQYRNQIRKTFWAEAAESAA